MRRSARGGVEGGLRIAKDAGEAEEEDEDGGHKASQGEGAHHGHGLRQEGAVRQHGVEKWIA